MKKMTKPYIWHDQVGILQKKIRFGKKIIFGTWLVLVVHVQSYLNRGKSGCGDPSTVGCECDRFIEF